MRASTAAPARRRARSASRIHSRDGGRRRRGAVPDGGVSPFSDPSLQLLMLAGLQGHGFRWSYRAGQDSHLVSVGTGTHKQKPQRPKRS